MLSRMISLGWLTLLLATCSTVQSLTDGDCMQDTIDPPDVMDLAPTFSPLMVDPESCKASCFIMNYAYAAMEDGRFCFCFDDPGALTSATASTCDATCTDGSTCGGSDDTGLLTVWETVADSGTISLTLDAEEYAIGSTVTATVNASAAWRIDWGDGSDDVINATTHTYDLPGGYDVTAYLDPFPTITTLASLNVYEAPNGSLVCPPLLTLNEESVCEFTTVSQGQDLVLDQSYTEPGFTTLSCPLPGEVSALYGSSLGTASVLGPTTIAEGDLIILERDSARSGKVARIEASVETTGFIALYGVQPACTSGNYCWENGQCSSVCTQVSVSTPASCSGASFFCVSSVHCSADSCASSTSPNSGLSYRFIANFYVDSTSAPFTYLFDYLSADVYDGERLAIGCAVMADCFSDPASVKKRNATGFETGDQLATVSTAPLATAGAITTDKHLVRVLVRDDDITPLNFTTTCTQPSSVPTDEVPTPFDASTEDYVLKGGYNLTYTLTSNFIGSGSLWTSTQTMLCQQEVVAPTLAAELWVPLDIDTPFPVTFSLGAPIFVSLDLGPKFEYHYKDDATDYVWTITFNYADTGDYTLVGNVTNALNWEPFTSLIHVVPIVTDTWTATATCLCLTWEDGFEVVLSFPSAPDPPWSGNITATYSGGDLFPPEVLDFGTKDGDGAAVPLTITRNVVVSTPGNHTVTFFLINEVSNTTFTTVIEVNEHITNVTAEMRWVDRDGNLQPGLGELQNSFMVNDTMIFFPSTLTGYAYQWKIAEYPETADNVIIVAPGDNLTLSHIFTEERQYNITISAYNDVQGWVDSEPYTIEILTQITNFELKDTGEIAKPNETIVITASFDILPPVSCIMIDYDEEDPFSPVETHGYRKLCEERYPDAEYVGDLPNPKEFHPHYAKEGLYKVVAFAFDQRISKRLDLGVIVADFPCVMPEVDVLDKISEAGDAPRIFRSFKFSRDTKSVIECNVTVPVSRWWTITKVDEFGAPIKDIPVEGVLPSWNYSEITIPALFLDYGLYELRYFLLVNASILFPLQRDDFTYFEIIATPISAMIMEDGMSSVSRGFAQELFLNPAGLSIDPDYPNEKEFNVTWFCRQLVPNEETHPLDGSGNYYEYNNQTIPAPLVAIKADLTGGGCYGVGPGSLILNSGSYNFKMQSFVLAEGTFEILAVVSKGDRTSTATMRLVVMENNPPTVQIRCVDEELCMYFAGSLLINPSSRLALVGDCVADCEDPMGYVWDIGDSDGNPVVETADVECPDNANATTLSANECEGVFLTTKFAKDFALGTLFFKINPTVLAFVFKLSGTNPITKKTGFAQNLIRVNQAPRDGVCTVSADDGWALIDTFKVSCLDWKDPEDMDITTYAYYTYSNGTAGTKKATMVASSSKEVDLIFPIGQFELRVEIWDIVGCYADVHIGFMNISLPTKEDVDNFNTSTVLQQLTASGDQVKLAMVLVASGSIRENADWLSLNTSSYTNMTDEEIMDRLREISAMNLDAVKLATETMNFGTLPQLNVGAEVLQSALDGILGGNLAALTVDMETRESALDLLDKMTDRIGDVKISSPQELVPFVGKAITSISALMTGINGIIENPSVVPPTDQDKAVDWDYDTDVGDDINLEIPTDRETMLRKNVLHTTRVKAKEQVDRMMEIVDTLSEKVLNKCIIGETVAAQTEVGAAVIISKVTEEILRNGMTIDPKDGKNASVRFPVNFCPSNYTIANTDCKKELGITTLVWPCVTHIFPDSQAFLTQKSRIMDVAVSIRGEKVDVTDEVLPIVLEIPREEETDRIPISVNTTECMSGVLPFVYHEFNVTNPYSAYTVEVGPIDDLPSQLVLLIDHERMPTPSQYLLIYLIQDLPISANGSFTLFVNSKENENKTGKFYVAVACLNDDVDFGDINDGKNLTRDDFFNFTSRYTFVAFTSGCYYYNDKTEQWTGDGLYVVETRQFSTVCETKHLTPFGSGYFAIPNAIDFQYVMVHAGFIDNRTLYAVLIVLTVMYIIMMIWARYMDKKDIEYRGVEPLEDNEVEDRYLYEITITTGPDNDAGTDSNIQFVMSGEYNETKVRILPPSEGRRFHRYQVDAFVMAVPGPLGDIDYLRIWHDNSGLSPFDNWQLQSIVVRDLQTRDKFVFRTDTWLGFDRTGTVDVLLKPTDKLFESFGREFYLKGSQSANDDNMWISIFLRPTGSRFSRKERVSIAALFLYLSLLINGVWYDTMPNEPINSLFDFGLITVSLEQFITGALSGCMIYPVTLILIFIFKRARPRRLRKCRALEAISHQRRSELEEESSYVDDDLLNTYDLVEESSEDNPSKDQNTVKCIPWWTRWFAWLFLLVAIGASMFLIWSYGVMWGETKTVKWFSSFIMSFLVSVLLVQWLNVLFITTLGAICCRKADITIGDIDCDEELPHLDYDEEWKNVTPMDPSMRHMVHGVGGVDPTLPYISSLVTKLTKKREMLFVLRDIGVYCLFLMILSVLLSGRTDPNAFLLQKQLTNAFIRHGHLEFDFSTKIITADHFWMWMHNVVMKEIRAQRLYNGEPPYGLKGFIGDLNNRIMGYAIIRQVRVDPRKCSVIKPLDQLIESCSGPRGLTMEEERNFCDSWKYIDDGDTATCQYSEFTFHSATELETFPQVGKLGDYGGGGYVIRLKGAQKDILERFKELQALGWIDRYTRAVMVEFSVFNANVNLFATASILAEFNEGGGITPKWRFEPIRLLSHDGAFGYIVFGCECIFVAATVMFTINEIWKIKKLKCEYFESYWNIAEICIILVSYGCIALYVYRYFLTREALEKFKQTFGNGYIRLDSAALTDQFYLYLIAMVVFFSILKLIKLLQFNKRMDVLALTIRSCWDELKIFFIAFGIVFFAFCCMFYFIFLTAIENFAKFISAIETSFKMMLGKFDFEEMNRANPISPILFFVFSVMNSMILINIMLTIILRAFNEVKVELESKENKYDVIDFVWSVARRKLRMDPIPDYSVNPNLELKKRKDSDAMEQNAEQLPDKVSQLMNYISETYFNGKINLNDPSAIKKIMQSSRSSADPRRPYTSSNLNMTYSGKRNVISSS